LKRMGRWTNVGMQVGVKARSRSLRARAEGKARMQTVSPSLLCRQERRVCGPILSPRADYRHFQSGGMTSSPITTRDNRSKTEPTSSAMIRTTCTHCRIGLCSCTVPKTGKERELPHELLRRAFMRDDCHACELTRTDGPSTCPAPPVWYRSRPPQVK
jgi:hypothetical protein